MLSLAKLFLEAANVPSEQANGLTAPFGVVNPSERNKKLLADAQSLSGKSAEDQAKWMNKFLK